MSGTTNPYQQIIVPCDGLPDEVTVEVASGVARRLGAPVVLFSVVSAGYRSEDRDELASFAERSGAGVVAIVVDDDGRPIETQLAEYASAPGVLMCMRTHAEPAIVEALFGSIGEAVLRSASRPILAVGPQCRPHPGGRTMIVAVDQDLIHPSTDAAWLGEVLELATAADYVPQYVTITADASTGSPATVATRLSESDDVPLIAADIRSTPTLQRVLVGSATVQLLRHAHCPVLLRGHAGDDHLQLVPKAFKRLDQAAALPAAAPGRSSSPQG